MSYWLTNAKLQFRSKHIRHAKLTPYGSLAWLKTPLFRDVKWQPHKGVKIVTLTCQLTILADLSHLQNDGVCPDSRAFSSNCCGSLLPFLWSCPSKAERGGKIDIKALSLLNYIGFRVALIQGHSRPETNNLPKFSRRILLFKERCNPGQKDWQPRQTRQGVGQTRAL